MDGPPGKPQDPAASSASPTAKSTRPRVPSGPIIEDITDSYSDSGYEADYDERLIYPSSYEDARSASPGIGTDDEDDDCLLLNGRAQGAHKAEREEVPSRSSEKRNLQDPGNLAQVFQKLKCEKGEREKSAASAPAAAFKPQPHSASTTTASTLPEKSHVTGVHSRTASQGSTGVKRSHKEEGLTSSDEEVMADRADATPEHRRMKRRTEWPLEFGEDFGREPDLIGAMDVDTPAQLRAVNDY